MPGLVIKNELELFKSKLENLVNQIEINYDRILMKETLWRSLELLMTHISFIEDLLKEREEEKSLSVQQKERATTLLFPFHGLIKLEQLLRSVRENSAGDSASEIGIRASNTILRDKNKNKNKIL